MLRGLEKMDLKQGLYMDVMSKFGSLSSDLLF